MTDLDLDAIEARANAATPGPWMAHGFGPDDHWLRTVRVAAALRDNLSLWRSAWMDRPGSLIVLRDLPDGHINIDTLFVLPEHGQESALESLARGWSADEVGWVGGEEACSLIGHYSTETRSNKRSILRLWWD